MQKKTPIKINATPPPAPNIAYFPLISHCIHRKSEQVSEDPNHFPGSQVEVDWHQTQLVSLTQVEQVNSVAHPVAFDVIIPVVPDVEKPVEDEVDEEVEEEVDNTPVVELDEVDEVDIFPVVDEEEVKEDEEVDPSVVKTEWEVIGEPVVEFVE